MNYLIGDLQGCCDAFDRLLQRIDFSPSRDHVYLLGDLSNRGPATLATLRRVQGLGASATSLLGNHDLSLLAVAFGEGRPHKGDTIGDVLAAPDRHAIVDWLRHQRLAVFEHGWLMVHAGVVPQWDLNTTLALAAEVEQRLRGPDARSFLEVMYGNEPSRWSATLSGDDRLRFTVNVLTRLRFCTADGTLDMKSKDGVGEPPAGSYRWFDAPRRRTASVPIAFGHWSTLGLIDRPDLLSLDTGCVWGGQLTAMRIDDAGQRLGITQVQCEQAQRPG